MCSAARHGMVGVNVDYRPMSARISSSGAMICLSPMCRSWVSVELRRVPVRLDLCRPDHLAPFLGFLGNQFGEIRRRFGQHHAAKIGKPDFNVRSV
jgi:hypothetical protein